MSFFVLTHPSVASKLSLAFETNPKTPRENMTTPAARNAAHALHAAFGERDDVTALPYTLDGEEYVVTSGTGEGFDFAYHADDIEIDENGAILSGWSTVDEDGEPSGNWSYTRWCDAGGHSPVADLNVAVAYYLETGNRLGVGGACKSILSDEQVACLDVVRRLNGQVQS